MRPAQTSIIHGKIRLIAPYIIHIWLIKCKIAESGVRQINALDGVFQDSRFGTMNKEDKEALLRRMMAAL